MDRSAGGTCYVVLDRPSWHTLQGQRERITGAGTSLSEGRRSAMPIGLDSLAADLPGAASSIIRCTLHADHELGVLRSVPDSVSTRVDHGSLMRAA